MNYYHRYPGDYAGKTAHLTMIEDGAYNRLLDWQYTNERPLPEDKVELYRIARAMSAAEKKAAEKMAQEFFRHEGWNDRAYVEIQKAKPRITAARENGAKSGGRPRKVSRGTNPVGFSGGSEGAQEITLVGNPVGFENETQQKPTGNPDGSLPKPYTETSKANSRGADAPCDEKPSGFCLPDWIDRAAWDGFEEMRKKIRKPMTNRARDLIVRKLAGFRQSGHDVASLLDASTRNDWQDIYEPRHGRGMVAATAKDYTQGVKSDGTF